MKKVFIILIVISLLSLGCLQADVTLRADKIVDQPWVFSLSCLGDDAKVFLSIPDDMDWYMFGVGPVYEVAGIEVESMLGFSFYHNGYFAFESYNPIFILSKQSRSLSFYSRNIISLDESSNYKNYKAKHYIFFQKTNISLGPEILVNSSSETDKIIIGGAIEYDYLNTVFEIFAGKDKKADKYLVKFELSYTF